LLPGVMTPSEVMAAVAAGHRVLKLFPAEPAGGMAMLKALHGPFPDVAFCPTGGITPERLADYLALPNVIAVGGSWVTTKAAIEAGEWQAITDLARQASRFRPSC
ncbi:MAG: keto-deoxy-phosphogluconate aldolase, partial [Dongiaceae bacterium]